MQIHELNNFTGTLGSGAYLAIDDGTDTGKISSQGLLAATEARIDNIIAGPAPSAEEIVDARLGADGVTYPSLGDAIRDQFTDVKSDIRANIYPLQSEDFESGTWENGQKATTNRRLRTKTKIAVKRGEILYINSSLYVGISLNDASPNEYLKNNEAHNYIVPSDGTICLLLANGSTYSTSTAITIDDFNGEFLLFPKFPFTNLENRYKDGGIKLYSDDIQQGTVENGTKVSATNRIRYKYFIPVKPNNYVQYDTTLYINMSVVKDGVTIQTSGWITGSGAYKIVGDGDLNIVFANGATYATSTSITPSDFAGDVVIHNNGYEIINVNDLNNINASCTLNSEKYDFGFVIGTLRPSDGKEDTGTARIRSDYIRIGKGSVVFCNNTIQNTLIVYEYDADKSYIRSSAWTDGNRYIVKNDGYIRILERKNASDSSISSADINTLANYIEIYRSISQNLIESVGDSGATIPSYFKSQIANAITSIRNNLMSIGKDGDAFAFITDLHWSSNQKHSPNLMRKIVNNTNIDKIICGGDLIGGGARNAMIANMSDCVDSFKDITRFYSLFGNHDTNTLDGAPVDAQFAKGEAYALMQKQVDFVMNYGDLCYFYFDNPTTKTRYICMDTGVEGTLLSSAQSNWLTATLDSMPDNYHALIFAHILYYPTTSYHIGLTPAELAETDFAYELYNVLDTFNANNSQKKVEAIFGGHLHIDANFITNGGIPIVLTDCDTRQTFTETSSGSGVANHAIGTVNEQCFDVTTIDYANKTIKCVRVGRGNDRTINY